MILRWPALVRVSFDDYQKCCGEFNSCLIAMMHCNARNSPLRCLQRSNFGGWEHPKAEPPGSSKGQPSFGIAPPGCTPRPAKSIPSAELLQRLSSTAVRDSGNSKRAPRVCHKGAWSQIPVVISMLSLHFASQIPPKCGAHAKAILHCSDGFRELTPSVGGLSQTRLGARDQSCWVFPIPHKRGALANAIPHCSDALRELETSPEGLSQNTWQPDTSRDLLAEPPLCLPDPSEVRSSCKGYPALQ